ncbi:MAG: hypothetical protein WBC04_00295 [Candidatus Acidiferrales bacterium]
MTDAEVQRSTAPIPWRKLKEEYPNNFARYYGPDDPEQDVSEVRKTLREYWKTHGSPATIEVSADQVAQSLHWENDEVGAVALQAEGNLSDLSIRFHGRNFSLESR